MGAPLKVRNAIIAEALGEGTEGMRLVAASILNRTNIRGMTPEQVVTEDGEYTGVLNPGSSVKKSFDDPAVIARVDQIWDDMSTNGVPAKYAGVDYYHTGAVSPNWASGFTKKGQEGAHLYYSSGDGEGYRVAGADVPTPEQRKKGDVFGAEKYAQDSAVTLSELSYSTSGVRGLPIKAELADALRQSVTAVYGADYRVDVMSAAQPEGPKGTPGTTGTRRHGTGIAADVWVYAPDGRKLQADELVPLTQHWLATGLGSVGFPAKAGSALHLDLIGGKGPGSIPFGPKEGPVWYYGTPTSEQRKAIEAALANGVLPKYAVDPNSAVAAIDAAAPGQPKFNQPTLGYGDTDKAELSVPLPRTDQRVLGRAGTDQFSGGNADRLGTDQILGGAGTNGFTGPVTLADFEKLITPRNPGMVRPEGPAAGMPAATKTTGEGVPFSRVSNLIGDKLPSTMTAPKLTAAEMSSPEKKLTVSDFANLMGANLPEGLTAPKVTNASYSPNNNAGAGFDPMRQTFLRDKAQPVAPGTAQPVTSPTIQPTATWDPNRSAATGLTTPIRSDRPKNAATGVTDPSLAADRPRLGVQDFEKLMDTFGAFGAIGGLQQGANAEIDRMSGMPPKPRPDTRTGKVSGSAGTDKFSGTIGKDRLASVPVEAAYTEKLIEVQVPNPRYRGTSIDGALSDKAGAKNGAALAPIGTVSAEPQFITEQQVVRVPDSQFPEGHFDEEQAALDEVIRRSEEAARLRAAPRALSWSSGMSYGDRQRSDYWNQLTGQSGNGPSLSSSRATGSV